MLISAQYIKKDNEMKIARSESEYMKIHTFELRNCLSCVYNCDDHSLIQQFKTSRTIQCLMTNSYCNRRRRLEVSVLNMQFRGAGSKSSFQAKVDLVRKGRFTRYDFVAYDKLTAGLRHELFRVNQTYNSLTTVVYVTKNVVGF